MGQYQAPRTSKTCDGEYGLQESFYPWRKYDGYTLFSRPEFLHKS